MERERRSENSLPRVLDDIGKPSDDLDNVGRRESLRSDEICKRIAVEHYKLAALVGMPRDQTATLTDTKASASNTVGDGTQPCQLWLVDGEVGAAGTLQPLFVEDLLRGRGWQRLRLYTARNDREVTRTFNTLLSGKNAGA